mgnify:CR=1 FL=1
MSTLKIFQNKVKTTILLFFSLSIGLNAQVEKTQIFSRDNGYKVLDSELFLKGKNQKNGSKSVIKVSPFYPFGAATPKNLKMKRRIVIKFDISEIPAGATIKEANLTLYKNGTISSSRVLNVHRIKGSWKENEISWKKFANNNSFVSPRTTYQDVFHTVANDKVVWNVVNDVQKMVNGDFPNGGWLIKDSYENAGSDIRWKFRSSENSKRDLRPTLEVTWELPQSLEISSTKNSICSGETSKLTASGGSNYSWKVNGVQISTAAVLDVSPTETTTYEVTANVNGSSVSKSVTITVNTTPSITLNTSKATNGCNGEISVVTTGNITQFSWTKDGGVYHSSSKDIIDLCGGDYTLKVTDANGCSIEETAVIGECPTIDVSVEKKDVCFGASNGEIALTGGSSVNTPSCPGKLYDNLCNDFSYQSIGSQTGSITVNKGDVVVVRGSCDEKG